jgi:hypothetical protein
MLFILVAYNSNLVLLYKLMCTILIEFNILKLHVPFVSILVIWLFIMTIKHQNPFSLETSFLINNSSKISQIHVGLLRIRKNVTYDIFTCCVTFSQILHCKYTSLNLNPYVYFLSLCMSLCIPYSSKFRI